MKKRKITLIVIHCSFTDVTTYHITESIRTYHTTVKGWSDIGYHYVIERDGTCSTGRDESLVGAHCKHFHNSNFSIGI